MGLDISSKLLDRINGYLIARVRIEVQGLRDLVEISANGGELTIGFHQSINLYCSDLRLAQQVGADIDAIFFCPHAGADNCDCRKPKPGMFHEISQRYNISLKGVPTVGDSLRDLQAGFISGCVPYLVLTGKGEKTNETGGLPPGTQVFPDLAAVVSHLLKAPAVPAPTVALSI